MKWKSLGKSFTISSLFKCFFVLYHLSTYICVHVHVQIYLYIAFYVQLCSSYYYLHTVRVRRCVCVCVCVCVCACALSCSVLSDSLATPWTEACQAPLPMGIFQARILEWVSISFSRGSSPHRYGTHLSCIERWVLYHCTTWVSIIILLKVKP